MWRNQLINWTIVVVFLAGATGLFAQDRKPMSPEEAMKLMKQSQAKKELPADNTTKTTGQEAEGNAKGKKELKPAAPFDYEKLSPMAKALFKREAKNYLRVGDEIWAMELWLRAKKYAKASMKNREHYLQKDTPLFYNPVTGKQARTLREINKVEGYENAELVIGRVMAANYNGMMLATANRYVFLIDTPEGTPTKKKAQVFVIAQVIGSADYTFDGKPKQAPRYQCIDSDKLRMVTSQELATYFYEHKVDRFEQWRFKKVWDELPRSKRVYVDATGVGASMQKGGRNSRSGQSIGVGQSQPVDVVTNPGRYHFKWIRGGKRVPVMRMDVKKKEDENKG